MPKVVHQLIAETAKGIAHEAYEDLAHDNAFFQEWPQRRVFVKKNWQMFVDAARASLVKILQGDYSDAMKQPIYEALLIDGSQKAEAAPLH